MATTAAVLDHGDPGRIMSKRLSGRICAYPDGASGAQNDPGTKRIEYAVREQRLQNVYRNDFAEHQPGLKRNAVPILQLQHVDDFALEIDRTLSHARRCNHARGERCQSGQQELVGFVRNRGAAGVH